MKARALALGALAAVAWTVAAQVSFERGLQPVRPLYDGTTPPPPYRWVEPPPEFADGNVPPKPVTRTFDLEAGARSPSESLVSEDTQASIVFSEGAFEVPEGATGVEVTFTPLEPSQVDEEPKGLVFQGNAYRIEAVYLPAREGLRFVQPCPEVTSCLTVILRYPASASELLRSTDGAWAPLAGAQHVPSSFQVYANADGLGTFVAAGEPGEGPRNDRFQNLLAVALGAAAVGGAVLLSAFTPARRRQRALASQRKRQASSTRGDRKDGRGKGARDTRRDRTPRGKGRPSKPS